MTVDNLNDQAIPTKRHHIKPRIWIGFAAAAFSILMAAGLGNLVGFVFPGLSELEEFAWSHFIPLPIAIVAGYWFLKRAGWTEAIWRSTPAYSDKHRRRWLLLFPILLAAQAVVALATVPWSEASIVFILIALFATILVAVNEELYFRGILRFTTEQLKSQTLTLLIVSGTFGLAHSFSSLIENAPLAFIAFQVGGIALTSVAYYAAFIATGRLWVPIAFHFVTDFTLRLANGETGIGPVSSGDPSPVTVGIQMVIFALTLPLIVSTIRYDMKVRKDNKAVAVKT